MQIKRWRSWLTWGLGCLGLVGLGFALDAWLPVWPRFVLRDDSSHIHCWGSLSPDGKILITKTKLVAADGASRGFSLKSWDTYSGRERGDFGRGLSPLRFWPFMHHDDVYPGEFSPDGRYCALAHSHGLGVADAHSGRQWPTAVLWKEPSYIPQSAKLYRLLQQPVEMQGLAKKVALKVALDYIAKKFDDKLSFVVDREAFAADLGADVLDPEEQEVVLPATPATLSAASALHHILLQVCNGNACYRIGPDGVTITTNKGQIEHKVGLPVFSPRSTYVVQAEGRTDEIKLHIVDCCCGEVVASLSAAVGTHNAFGFTGDDELFFYFAPDKEKALLSVWNTRTRQVVWTCKDIEFVEGADAYQVSPDGRTLLANTHQTGGDGVVLFDLRTGQTRRFFQLVGPKQGIEEKEAICKCKITPDGKTLVRATGTGKLQAWDLASGKMRWSKTIEYYEPELLFSPNSRVCVLKYLVVRLLAGSSDGYAFWNLETGERILDHDGFEFAPPQDYSRSSLGLPSRPYFTRNFRYLVDIKKDHINILVPETGERLAQVSLGANLAVEQGPQFSPNGQWMLSWWELPEHKPSLLETWLAKWWRASKPTSRVMVSEVAAGRMVSCHMDEREFATLSDDGGTLVTFGKDVIYLWDVPGKPSRILVLGIPLAVALIAGTTRWWFVRRKRTLQQLPTGCRAELITNTASPKSDPPTSG